MLRPVPGKQYTVVKTDNLWNIAGLAYGDSTKWKNIWEVNKSSLRSGDPNLIYPGEILIIPKLPELEAATISGDIELPEKDPYDFTLIIDGYEVIVQAARVVRTLNTAADGWSCTAFYNENDDKLIEITKPFSMPEAKVYIGGRLLVSGLLYVCRPQISPDGGSYIELEGGSTTMNLIDSSVLSPYERRKVTLKQVAESIVSPYGIPIVYDAPVGDPFKKTTASKSDKIIAYLNKLASQRDAVISSTKNGELLFTQAKRSTPISVLEENIPPLNKIETEFNARNRYRNIKVVGTTPKTRKLTYTAVDSNISQPRNITIEADETETDLQKVAEWHRSKQIATALTFDLTVLDWYTKNKELWEENKMVTVKSKKARIPDGYDLLIKSVEFVYEPSGRTARLSLVPVETFTGEEIEDPWK